MLKDIEEAVEHFEKRGYFAVKNGGDDIQSWLRHLLSIISQQKEIIQIAVSALKEVDKEYMRYIENEITVDSAATRMDNTAEDALAEIKNLEEEFE